jgi:phage repressor protein C with HTH and peptisase S24 domain
MFPTTQVGNFRLPAEPRLWEISDMSDADHLRGKRLYDVLMKLKPDELFEGDWATKAGVNRGFFTDLKKATGGAPRSDTLRKLLSTIGATEADMYGVAAGGAAPSMLQSEGSDDPVDTVGIQHIDMAYGLGATFAVDHPEIEVLQFPKQWIETITHSPPAMLTWTRGKGDSMEPTIRDGDLVLLDRSQRALTERDAMWAFTIGEEAAIKRLRRQGDRCEIFSDNPSVKPDEQNLRDMNIVGRVVFVGSRK